MTYKTGESSVHVLSVSWLNCNDVSLKLKDFGMVNWVGPTEGYFGSRHGWRAVRQRDHGLD